MGDYIEREQALREFDTNGSHFVYGLDTCRAIQSRLKMVPAADVRENVSAFNLRKAFPSLFKCSRCGWGCDDTYYSDTPTFNFCPNCGADMREAE